MGLIDDKAGPIVLGFQGGTLANATSNSILISPSSATQLVIHLQPSSTASAGLPFATQPVVYEEDPYGNLETGDNSTVVTATLATGSGPLQGSTTVVKGGVATFTNLLDKKVETITLGFGGPNLTGATSNSIVVNKPIPVLTWDPVRRLGHRKAVDHPSPPASPRPPGGPIPTGSVTFLDGSTVLGSSTLNSKGQATFSTASLPPPPPPLGTQSISVKYSGDPNYASSTSPTSSLYIGDLPKGDFDGDGKADVAIYDATTATFYIQKSAGGSLALPFGNPSHVNIAVMGDFDGDGKTDIAIYDQTAATFYILPSGGGPSIALPFGNPSHVNIPVAGDFRRPGQKRISPFTTRPAATFYIQESGGKSVVEPFGNPSHVNIPVAGDYDGDGKTDIAIYDQTAATFYIQKSGGGPGIIAAYGNPAHKNIPIAGDFDGDGKTDIAIDDQTTATFYVLESTGKSIVAQVWQPGPT